MSKGSTFWRQAGFSYLQYLSIASRALRGSLKVNLMIILATNLLLTIQMNKY